MTEIGGRKKIVLRVPTIVPRGHKVVPKSDKVGLFIHWGIYTVPAHTRSKASTSSSETHNGSEWYLGWIKNRGLYGPEIFEHHKKVYGDDTLESVEKRYYNEWLTQFDLESDQPEVWDLYADYAVKLGMQYIILTVKHHDGIMLCPGITGYQGLLPRSTNEGKSTKIDHVDRFSKACRARGLKVGIYFSLMEWAGKRVCKTPYTKGKGLSDYCQKILWPSLKHICLKYRPDILWADGHWPLTVAEWGSLDFLRWFMSELPGSTINDRWGKDFPSLITADPAYADLRKICCLTGKDRLISSATTDSSWEHVNTIGDSWGYCQNNPRYKTSSEILSLYDRVKAGNGRFTLNIGPRIDGSLDPKEEEILKELISKGGFV